MSVVTPTPCLAPQGPLPRTAGRRGRPRGAPPTAFDIEDATRLCRSVGANCGPGALAGVTGISLDAAVAILPGFVSKGYTTETMLRCGLDRLGLRWTAPSIAFDDYGIQRCGWPRYGLARVQWDGPWMRHARVFDRLPHSHWIGVAARRDGDVRIFDHNAIAVGGWIPLQEWDHGLRPWLLQAAEPLASGRWWLADICEIDRRTLTKGKTLFP